MRLLFAAMTAATLGLAACGGGGGGGSVPPINSEDIVLGDPNAPVEIIEYAAASCSHCAEFAHDVFPEIKAKYIDTGQARYTLREVLLSNNDAYGQAGFLLARCVPEERYYAMLDAVFRGQAIVGMTGDMRGTLLEIARSAGMTEADFNACLTDEDATAALGQRIAKNVQDYGFQGTPTIYFNGEQPFPSGVPPMEDVDEAMEAALAE